MNIFRRWDLSPAREQEIIEELSQQLEQSYSDAIARGTSDSDARARAISQLSNLPSLAEEIRRAEQSAPQAAAHRVAAHIPGAIKHAIREEEIRKRSGGKMFADTMQDFRFALRMFRKSPGFAAIVVLTLALGIGANSTIFSIINAVMLRPLPYANADRVMMLYESNPSRGFPQFSASPANFSDWRDQNRSFEHVAALTAGWFGFSANGAAERIMGTETTSGFFQMLGVNPVLGRAFSEEEYQKGKTNVALLNYGFWQRGFGGDPSAIGKAITIDGKSCTIIGVLPKGFDFEDSKSDVWIPLAFSDEDMSHRGAKWLNVAALRKSGITVAQANADLAGVAGHLATQYPKTNTGWSAYGISLREDIVGDAKPALLVLFGAVFLVLLIACANAANMLLARASVRRREIAIRTAMGASRGRVIAQLLTESVVLSLAGGVAGLALAFAAVRIVKTLPDNYLPMAYAVNLEPRVLIFTFVIALAVGILFGLAPAVLNSRSDVQETLKETTRSMGGGRASRLRNALIVCEVALSLVLLLGSGLLLRSFAQLSSVPTGFRTDHALSFMLNGTEARYPKAEQQAIFFGQVAERLRALPGVEGVAMTSLLPLSGHNESYSYNLANVEEGANDPSVDYAVVNPDYFSVMGISLLSGRLFTERDTFNSAPVCLLNEKAARAMFPNGDAIGHLIQFGRQHKVAREIVGIVSTVKEFRLSEKPQPEGYEPVAQRPESEMSFVVRSHGDPGAVAREVREQIRALDPEQPVAEVLTLDELLSKSVALPRFRTVLLGVFAALALLLAAVGLYGVLSYSVTQRTQEIGIRMALGAQRGAIYSGVIGRGMLLVSIGLAIGVAAAMFLTGFISTFLYGVQPRDPATIFGVVGVFAAIALVACWIPARRASRVDPLVALRYE